MSSKVPKGEREQRGSPGNLSELPHKISNILLEMLKRYDQVVLYGSYGRGNYADDSDVDIGLPNVGTERLKLMKELTNEFGMKIDISDIIYAKNHPFALYVLPDGSLKKANG